MAEQGITATNAKDINLGVKGAVYMAALAEFLAARVSQAATRRTGNLGISIAAPVVATNTAMTV
jgi:hypothetical protein